MKTIKTNYGGFEIDQQVDESIYNAIYKKAIDDFVEECLKHKSKDEYEYQIMCFDEFTIRMLAEKVKNAGGKNDN